MGKIGLGVTLLSVLLAMSPVASAQAVAEVVLDEVAVDFPDKLTFTLHANVPAKVDRAELRFEIHTLSCSSSVTTAVADVFGSEQIRAVWEWDLRRGGGLPSGGTVTYSWRLSGPGGTFDTPPRVYTHQDPRFEWKHLVGEHTELAWYGDDARFAENVLALADAGVDRLADMTGFRPTNRVAVYIYENAQALRGGLIFPGEFVGGVAYPNYGLVAVGMSPANWDWGRRAIVHEITHVVLGQKTFVCGANIPAWLNEGIAMYNEGPLEPHFEEALSSAIKEDKVLSLGSIAGAFPDDRQGVMLSYAQSFSVTEYLLANHGADGMEALLNGFAATGDIEQALIEAYGFGRVDLENRWRESVGLQARDSQSAPGRIRLPEIEPLMLPTPGQQLTGANEGRLESPLPNSGVKGSSGAGCTRTNGDVSGVDGAIATMFGLISVLALRRTP